MMNDERLIERYFCGELPTEERAAFEERRSADGAFRREVEAYEKTLRTIRLEGRKQLQGRLAERGRQLDAEKKSPRSRLRWWLGLAALVVVCAVWFFGKNAGRPSPVKPESETRQDSIEAAVPDTFRQSETPPTEVPPQVKTTEKQPVAGTSSRHAELFAAYFQPYRDESLEPSVRGEGEATPEENFLQLYWDGKCREALAAFENMEPASKSKGDLQFLKANCLLAAGQAKAAKTVLEDLGRTRFSSEAKWLLALAFLKNGERAKAKAQLQIIADDTASLKRYEAAKLLKELN